jgi:hypothetical protein
MGGPGNQSIMNNAGALGAIFAGQGVQTGNSADVTQVGGGG